MTLPAAHGDRPGADGDPSDLPALPLASAHRNRAALAHYGADDGPRTGGGMVEKCHNLPIWEMRAIFSDVLARELFGFDGSCVVLLHGYVKRVRQPASTKDLNDATQYWRQYLKTRKVSPEQPAD